jgi:hypothetical protein
MNVVVTNTENVIVIGDNTSSILFEKLQKEIIVTAGTQGIPGVPGTSPNAFNNIQTDIELSGIKLLIKTDIGLGYCDAENTLHLNRVLGFSDGNYSIGQYPTIIEDGELTNPSWNFILGWPVFAGVNGEVVQEVLPSYSFHQIVGTPISSNTLRVHIHKPIQIGVPV